MSRDEAVKAAAEALHALRHPGCTWNDHARYYRPEAEAAVDAATPHVRAQAAAEVRANCGCPSCDTCARVVEGP